MTRYDVMLRNIASSPGGAIACWSFSNVVVGVQSASASPADLSINIHRLPGVSFNFQNIINCLIIYNKIQYSCYHFCYPLIGETWKMKQIITRRKSL